MKTKPELLSIRGLSRESAISATTIRRRLATGAIQPDFTIGREKLFVRARLPEIIRGALEPSTLKTP